MGLPRAPAAPAAAGLPLPLLLAAGGALGRGAAARAGDAAADTEEDARPPEMPAGMERVEEVVDVAETPPGEAGAPPTPTLPLGRTRLGGLLPAAAAGAPLLLADTEGLEADGGKGPPSSSPGAALASSAWRPEGTP